MSIDNNMAGIKTLFNSIINEKASVAVSFDMQYLEQKYMIQNEFKLRNVLR